MFLPPIIRALPVSAALCLCTSAAGPIRVSPQNPRLLEYQGETYVGLTFGEHYGAVIHPDFDFIRYLDGLKKDGLNLTRVLLLGFRFHQRTGEDSLSPPAGRFLQPWQRSGSHGLALDGQGKWDFTRWNEAYFSRLRDFLQAARDRGIVVEACFFNTIYDNEPEFWTNSPFHPSNNVQGFGPASAFDTMRGTDADLTGVMEQAVRRVVRELNGFDNVYYEIQNEPCWNQPGIGEAAEVAFHNQFLGIIRGEEAALPKRHLVAHNFPNELAGLSNDFDLINSHYPFTVPSAPWVIGGENLLAGEYSRMKPLTLDESSAYDAQSCRLESWMFVMGGGALYNGLDSGVFDPNAALVYPMADPSGNVEPGPSVRNTLRRLGTHTASLDLHGLRRDTAWISGGVPSGARLQGMSKPGQQYAAYLYHGTVPTTPYATVYQPIDTSNHSATLQVSLPAGQWTAVWTRPEDLTPIATETFNHAGGSRALQPVVYQADVALKIDRADSGDATAPPPVSGLVAGPPQAGSVALSWQPSPAADIAGYRIYHGPAPGVDTIPANRIGEVPATQTGFQHDGVSPSLPHFYQVTAVDSRGNESPAAREVESRIASTPFGGIPHPIPGTIQCEDFDEGGQGIAYQDLTSGNTGGSPVRSPESVDLAPGDDGGGIHLTQTASGESLRYTVRIAKTDRYDLRVRHRVAGPGCHLRFLIDGEVVVDSFEPASGGVWQTETIPSIGLTEGQRMLEFQIVDTGTSGSGGDFNWISFAPTPRVGPNARAGMDQSLADDDWNLTESVTLNADESLPGSQPIVSHTWLKDGVVLASGVNATISLPVGLHRIRLIATDAVGWKDEDETVVEVHRRGFVNGSFESGMDGWSAAGNVIASTSAPASQGARALVFGDSNTPSNGVVRQSFPTRPGQEYRLAFAMGVRAFNTQPQTLLVTVDGNTRLLSSSHSLNGIGGGNTIWSQESGSFIADSDETIIEFRDVSPTSASIDLLLDHIRITRVLSGGRLPETPSITLDGSLRRVGLFSPDVGTYELQRSSNLIDWTVISNLELIHPGWVEMTDPTPPPGTGFYRIGLSQP